jgi:hypothetical protein
MVPPQASQTNCGGTVGSPSSILSRFCTTFSGIRSSTFQLRQMNLTCSFVRWFGFFFLAGFLFLDTGEMADHPFQHKLGSSGSGHTSPVISPPADRPPPCTHSNIHTLDRPSGPSPSLLHALTPVPPLQNAFDPHNPLPAYLLPSVHQLFT